MKFNHTPVLLNEVIREMRIRPDGIYIDGTIGGAGHSLEIVKRLNSGRLIGIDRDIDALNASKEKLSDFKNKVTLIHDNYVNIREILKNLGIGKVDGILLDIGLSSFQIDDPGRGFSYRENAPLDMRMDKSSAVSAKDIVNSYTKEELARIIRTYGEEQFASNIAKHIVNEREKAPITTTGQLLEIIKHAIPEKVRGRGIGFAKKTFQAIRIEVNGELSVLKSSIDDMIDLLNPGARLLIITFHSLEDRIVKRKFSKAENPCTCPSYFPVCVCGAVSLGKTITKKPITPSEDEIKANKRARSSKLRVFERI